MVQLGTWVKQSVSAKRGNALRVKGDERHKKKIDKLQFQKKKKAAFKGKDKEAGESSPATRKCRGRRG